MRRQQFCFCLVFELLLFIKLEKRYHADGESPSYDLIDRSYWQDKSKWYYYGSFQGHFNMHIIEMAGKLEAVNKANSQKTLLIMHTSMSFTKTCQSHFLVDF